MTWFGKVGGGLLGFMAGGPVGAMIGTALGHQFDRGAAAVGDPRSIAGRATIPMSAAERERLVLDTTFQALGYFAKVDGRVSEDEIAAARSIMRAMDLDDDATARAIECFTLGKQPGFPIHERAAALGRACTGDPRALGRFIETQLRFLLSRDPVTFSQRTALLRVASAAGLQRSDLARLDALLRNPRRRTNGTPASPMSAPAAYRLLGLSPDATDLQVKIAYRRLMNRHHPDKHIGQDLPPSALEQAKERTREIRSAYDLIREQRDMR